MAIWEQIKSLELPQEERARLQQIYVSYNMLEIRDLFAGWIEETDWHELDQQNPDHAKEAEELFNTLLEKIEEKASPKGNDLLNQMKFISLGNTLKEKYASDPWLFVETLKNVLATEKQLIDSLTQPSMEVEEPPSPSVANTDTFMDELMTLTKNLDTTIKEYKQSQEKFVIEYQQFSLIDAEIQQIQANKKLKEEEKKEKVKLKERKKTEIEKALKKSADVLLKSRGYILSSLQTIAEQAESVSTNVYEKLLMWRITQQKSLSGGPKPGDLSVLQNWFESLMDIFWSLYQMTNSYKLLFEALPIIRQGNEKELMQRLLESAVTSLTMIIRRSFIVDKQPPQVLKTQTKFQTSVRLLVGAKLNLQLNCPTVKTTIVSEKQAKDLVLGKRIEDVGNCGDLLNCDCVMEYDQKTRAFSADFKNLSLKKIKRQDRRGQEVVSVLEAKSALVFTAGVAIGGDTLPVICISFPVVVVVHGNQGPSSEATIVWDNMFSKPDREPFDVPELVSWSDMEIALNARWTLTTEKELSRDHMSYIKQKLIQDVGGEETVSWTQFNRETLKDKNFTFWDWFYAAMEVVKKHLKEHWKSGYIQLMSRDKARECLMTKQPGTFLIRFSDGELGGVSIAWVHNTQGEKVVWNLQPFTAKDFTIRTLADSIFDLPNMTVLYPDIPKERAFGEFRSRDSQITRPAPNEYVPATIKVDLAIGRMSSNP